MKVFNLHIHTPIFFSRSIGINDYATHFKLIRIKILYKKKDGKRLYPNPFYIYGVIARKYPVMIRRGIRLYIVPIADLIRKDLLNDRTLQEDNREGSLRDILSFNS